MRPVAATYLQTPQALPILSSYKLSAAFNCQGQTIDTSLPGGFFFSFLKMSHFSNVILLTLPYSLTQPYLLHHILLQVEEESFSF